MQWGAVNHPVYAIELILNGLYASSGELLLASLEAISKLGEAGMIFATKTGRFIKHCKPEIRHAAAVAGAVGVDWALALADEKDVSVKMTLLMRLVQERGAAAAQVLIKLLEEGDYRLRAAATAALQRIGAGVVDLMKPLMQHPLKSVQVAAAQVLISAGEQMWLEEHQL